MSDLLTLESYFPSKKQLEAHLSPVKYKLFGGAMNCGKSFWLCAEAIRLSLMYSGNVGLLTRYRYKDLKRSTLPILLQMVPLKVLKNYNKSDGIIEFINGSKIYFADLEDPNKLKSMNLGFFGIDEATDVPDEQPFNMLTTRLRLQSPGIKYFGLLATNPEPGWVKDKWITNPQENFAFFPALPQDNPAFTQEYIDDLIRTLPPALRARYLEGSWEAFDDMIFEPQWIIPGMPQSERLFKVMFVDPAISEKTTADETSITTTAFDEYFGLYHEFENVAGRWSFETIKTNVVAAIKRTKPDLIYVENVQAQDWLVQDLNAMGIPAIGFKPDRDKIRKAIAVQDMFSTGLVRVNFKETQQQLIDFPNGSHDDRMDSFISSLFIMKKMNLTRKDHYQTDKNPIRAMTPKDVIQSRHMDLAAVYKNMIG